MKESGRIIAPMLESRPETATEPRKLAAIMFTDIVGFSRQTSRSVLMMNDE